MARHATVCIPPIKPNRADITEGKRAWLYNDSNSTIVAGETVGSGVCTTALRPAMAITITQGSSLSSVGGDITPLPAETVSLGLACERLNLNAAGLPPKVIETIQNVRAADL